MLPSLLLLLGLLFIVSAAPTFTNSPSGTLVFKDGSAQNITCAATGSGTVTVAVQLSVCGGAFVNVSTGSGSGSQNLTYVLSVIDNDNCAALRCFASDSTGSTTSAPASVVVEFVTNATVNGTCAGICNVVQARLNGDGALYFAGFTGTYPSLNVTIYTGNYNFNLNIANALTVNNFTIKKNETLGFDSVGSVTMTFNGKKLTTNEFITEGNTVTISNTKVAAVTEIALCGNVISSSNNVFKCDGSILYCGSPF